MGRLKTSIHYWVSCDESLASSKSGWNWSLSVHLLVCWNFKRILGPKLGLALFRIKLGYAPSKIDDIIFKYDALLDVRF